MKSLPPNMSRLLSPADQKLVPGSPLRAREASEKAAEKSEREAQDRFAGWLRLNEYEFIRPPMFKRSALPLGFPDFCLSTKKGLAIGIEMKTPGAKLRPEQVARHAAMNKAGWSVFTAFSAAQAIEIIRGIEG